MLDSQDSRFFSALHALAIDHRRCRTDLPASQFPAFHVKCVMDPLQRPVVGPAIEIIANRALWWQVLRDRVPLAPGAEQIHKAIEYFPHVDNPLIATKFGGWDFGSDLGPLLSGRRGTADGCCRIGNGSLASTFGTSRIDDSHRIEGARVPQVLSANRLKRFEKFPNGHLGVRPGM